LAKARQIQELEARQTDPRWVPQNQAHTNSAVFAFPVHFSKVKSELDLRKSNLNFPEHLSFARINANNMRNPIKQVRAGLDSGQL
jgi:hypothetical protein